MANHLNEYDEKKMIGKGTYGEVWLVIHRTDNRKVYFNFLKLV